MFKSQQVQSKMNNYSKNFILCGEIEFHCLICEETFFTTAEVEKHLRWETHRKNLKTQTHLPKFKNNGIFKIGKVNYCEPCNRVFENIQSLKLHVKEESHKIHKETPILKEPIVKRESGNIMISHFPISYQHWHGILGKQCVFCDETITDFNQHIAKTPHMCKLINSECKKEDEDRCYRKINDNRIQCFPCKSFMDIQSFDGHLESQTHSDNVAVVKEENANKKNKLVAKPSTTPYDIFNNDYEIDEKNTKASCKKCKETIQLKITVLLRHSSQHNDENINNYIIFDHGKRRSELAKFGKTNFIKMAAKPGRGYCTVCCCYLSAHMNVFTDHVNGTRHTGILKIKEHEKLGINKRESKPPTKTFKSYVEELHFSELYKVMYINKEVCTNPENLLLFTVMDFTGKILIKCYCCDEVLVQSDEMKKHFSAESHKRNFFNTNVVTGLFSEFVREIRPNIFHCVYCNVIIPYWPTMSKHIETLPHRMAKLPYLKLCYDSESILSCKPLEHLNVENVLYSQLLFLCTLSRMQQLQ